MASRRTVAGTQRGVEISTGARGEIRVNGKLDLTLPADPFEVVKVLRARRDATPAGRLRAKIAAGLRRRGR